MPNVSANQFSVYSTLMMRMNCFWDAVESRYCFTLCPPVLRIQRFSSQLSES